MTDFDTTGKKLSKTSASAFSAEWLKLHHKIAVSYSDSMPPPQLLQSTRNLSESLLGPSSTLGQREESTVEEGLVHWVCI